MKFAIDFIGQIQPQSSSSSAAEKLSTVSGFYNYPLPITIYDYYQLIIYNIIYFLTSSF